MAYTVVVSNSPMFGVSVLCSTVRRTWMGSERIQNDWVTEVHSIEVVWRAVDHDWLQNFGIERVAVVGAICF